MKTHLLSLSEMLNLSATQNKKNFGKIKRAIFIAALLLQCFFTCITETKATTVQVGSGTSTTYYNPVYTYYGYSYTQQIYTSAEITAGGGSSGQQITAIRFYWSGTGDLVNSDTWTVYLGNTTQATFSSGSNWVGIGSLTQVYNGSVTLPGSAGWVTINLSTPYIWNGNNLVVAIDENVSGYTSYTYWRYTSTSTNYRTMYYGSDITNPDPSSPPTGTRTYNRPNIQFEMSAACTAPSTQATIGAFSGTTSSSTTVNWTRGDGTGGVVVVGRLTSTSDVPPSSGTSYTANSVFGSGDPTGTGNYVVYKGTGTNITVTGLSGSTSYTFTVYEYNTTGTCYKTPGSAGAVTTSAPPPPSNDDCAGATTLTVGAAATNGTVAGATQSLAASCGGTANDDVWYKFTTTTAGYYIITVVGSASFNAVTEVRSGACPTSYTGYCEDVTGNGGTEVEDDYYLSASTTYYFRVYDYDNDVPATQTFTVKVDAPGTCTPPTTQATIGAYTNNTTGTSITVNWARGNGTGGVIVVARLTSTANAEPVNGTSYTANATFTWGSEIGTDNYVVYKGTGTTVNVTGLTALTSYTFLVYEYNTTNTCYKTPGSSSPVTTVCTPPGSQATSFTTGTITATTMPIGWSRSYSGDGVLVVARSGSAVNQDPTNGTNYSANAAFGSGDQIGTGNWVVYKGSGSGSSVVTVTGLICNTTYHFAIYEYYTSGYCHLLSELTGNATTSACPPANDDCAGAVTITVGAAATGGTVAGATQTLAASCGGSANDDVWYKFTTTIAGNYIITVVGSASFDAVIDLRSGVCNGSNVSCEDVTANGGTEVEDDYSCAASTTYYIRVYDYDSDVPATPTFTIKVDCPPPPAPSSSGESGVTACTFNANWTSSSGATGYRLDVSTSSSFGSFVTGFNNLDVGNVLTYPVTGLSASSTYYYRVRAYSACGTSASSSYETVYTSSAISAPSIYSPTNIICNSFDANWSSVTGATKYYLDVSTSSSFGSFVTGYNNLDVGVVTTFTVNSGLNPGTTYYYRVRSADACGSSSNSSYTSATTSSIGTPTANSASNVTCISFQANWSAFAGATTYKLDVSTSSSFGSFVGIYNNLDAGNVTSNSVTGLANSTTYYYRIRAVVSCGTSPSSSYITTATSAGVPAPTSTAATNITPTSFSANWNAATGATKYYLDVSTINTFASFVSGYNDLDVGNVLTYSVTGLTTGTTYYYRVRGYSAACGQGPNSGTQSATPARLCPDCTPEDVTLGTAGIIGTNYYGYTASGNCGNGGKWVGKFTGEVNKIYHFDLCPNTPGTSGTGNFDADIKIVNSSCSILNGVDGSCSGGPNSYLPNDFTWTCTSGGTYYVIIAPYSSSASHTCSGTAGNTFTLGYYKESIIKSSVNGNWSAGGTWEGGVAPVAGDNVFIQSGDNVTVDITNAACAAMTINAGGTLTINNASNALTVGNSCGGNSHLYVKGTSGNAGTLNISNGTITIGGNLIFENYASFIMSGGNLNIDGNDGTSAGSIGETEYLFQIQTYFTTCNVTGGTITIVDPHFSTPTANPPTNDYGTAFYYLSGSSSNWTGNTLVFGGSSCTNASTATNGFVVRNYNLTSSGLKLGNVTINGNGGSSRDVSVTKYDAVSSMIIFGTLTVNANSKLKTLSNGSDLFCAGDITNNGTLEVVAGTIFGFAKDGSTSTANAQVVGGSGTYTLNGDVETRNTNASGITMGCNLTANGNLTMVSGIIKTENYDFTYSGANDINYNYWGNPYSATNMFATNGTGQLKRKITTSGYTTYDFPVGDVTGTTEYSPAQIYFSSNSTQRYIGVRVVNAQHPNYGSGGPNYINRYWVFTESTGGSGTYSYDGYLQYLQADVAGSWESNIKMQNWDGGSWSTVYNSSVNTTSNQLEFYSYTSQAQQTLNGAEITGRQIPPPANDECAGAILLTQGATCTGTTGDITNATQSMVKASCDYYNEPIQDVWYKFVANASGRVNVMVVDSGTTNPFNGLVAAYSGACGSLVEMTNACNNDYYGTERLHLTGLTNGTTYYIRVYHADWYTPINNKFGICLVDVPSNDDCVDAITLSMCAAPTAGTTVNAAYDNINPVYLGDGDDEVWYKFTAVGDSAQITLTGTSGFDGNLNLRNYNSCDATNIQYRDFTGNNGTERMNVTDLVPGQTYKIRVFSYLAGLSKDGPFNISVCNTPYTPTGNDNMCSAINIPNLATPVVGNNNTNYGFQVKEPDDGDFGAVICNTQWFTFTPPATPGSYSYKVTVSGGFNKQVSIYSAATCENVGTFIDHGQGSGDVVFCNLCLNYGTMYYIQVNGKYGATGTPTVRVDENIPVPPVATAATNITCASFTANWNAVTCAAGYYLDVSTDAAFGSFVSGYNNLHVGNVTSYGVAGLSPSTTYHYRVRMYYCASIPATYSGNSNVIDATTLDPLSVATISGGSTSVCSGASPGTFTATATTGGMAPFTYQWYLNGSPTGTSNTYDPGALTADADIYCAVTSSGSCGTANTSTAHVTVLTLSANISGGTTPICYNTSPGTFTATGIGGMGTYTYQWYTGTGIITGETNSTYNPGNITVSTDYYCAVTSGACGTANTPTKSIVVAGTPPTAYNVTGGGSYCSGSAAPSVGLDGSDISVNYQLYYAGSSFGSAVPGSGSSISFGTQIQAGTYTVIATDGGGCQNTMNGSADVSITNCVTSKKSVAINTTGAIADSSAILDVSETRGGVLLPRMTSAERDNLVSPDLGLIIYNTDSKKINFYSSGWNEIGSTQVSTQTGTTSISYGTAINAAGTPPTNSAMLDVSSLIKGVLFPRTLPGAILNAAEGNIIYNTSTDRINYFNGSAWIALSSTQVSVNTGSGSQNAEGVAINLNNANPAPSAILDVSAQNKGVLIPRLTEAQRDDLAPATGLIIYNTSADALEYYDGAWFRMQ